MTEQELMMSPTLPKLHELAKTMPVDVNDPEQLKDFLAMIGGHMIGALDGERIHFLAELDQGMFYALLAVITDYATGGNLKTAFKPATVN